MTDHERNDRTSQRRRRALRLGGLVAVLAVMTSFGIWHQLGRGSVPVGVDALCPFGGIEAAWTLATTGLLLPKIALSSFILLVAVIGTAIVFRRAFCGYVCPLGTIQELAARLGTRVFGKRMTAPKMLDTPARLIKYVVLIVFVVLSVMTAELAIRPYDPWVAWQHLTSKDLLADLAVGLAVLGITVAGSFVYDRFFCKYLCPMGASLALLSRLSFFKVRRDASVCIDCGACDTACPTNVAISTAATVDSLECIDCHECVDACPVKGALEVKTKGGASITSGQVLGGVAVIIALVIGVTTATGDFAWAKPSLAAAVKEVGRFDPAMITGRMTMREIVDASGIPAAKFTERFGVPAGDMDKPIKETKDAYGFTPEDVRAWVGEQLGTGYVPGSGGEGGGEGGEGGEPRE